MYTAKILLLGAGELGKEFVISAKRLGCYVVACDRYANAPAMQLADKAVTLDMLDEKALKTVCVDELPDYIVPEIEAIQTELLVYLEENGFHIVPSAKAVDLTMNRDRIRDFASKECQLPTAKYAYAHNREELIKAIEDIGFPVIIKPVMSSSGKGQQLVTSHAMLDNALEQAFGEMRGKRQKVIVEEYIAFESEITLLTVKQKEGDTLFVKPIGHRQEQGDYRESWLPAQISREHLQEAERMAKIITDKLGGYGLFGVEFFITNDRVIFSELSPRPHDTGMVTLRSQDLSEFDLHCRAILGLPIPSIQYYKPTASAVILADTKAEHFRYQHIDVALNEPNSDLRLFAKPSAHENRRMGVAIASDDTTEGAVEKAKKVASAVAIEKIDGLLTRKIRKTLKPEKKKA